MNKENSNDSKNPEEVALYLEIDRINQIHKEFMSDPEVQALIKQKSEIHLKIHTALRKTKKDLIDDYANIANNIEGLMINFFYKYNLIDRETINQIIQGNQKFKLDIRIL